MFCFFKGAYGLGRLQAHWSDGDHVEISTVLRQPLLYTSLASKVNGQLWAHHKYTIIIKEEFSEGSTAQQKRCYTRDLGSSANPATNKMCDSGQTTSPLWPQTSTSINMSGSIRLCKVPSRSKL